MTDKKTKNRSERGAIAIIVAAMLTTLSAFAALAIDVGFFYTKSRHVQAVADAAVRAGMATMPAATTSQNAALAIINANGTYATQSAVVSGNDLTVQITQVVPSFFGRMLGRGNKTLTGRAVGELISTPTGALVALGGCASGTGLSINGNATISITGDVTSNGPLGYQTGPAATTTTGVAQSPCAGEPTSNGAWNTITGGMGAGGPFVNPYASVSFASFPACTFGDLVSPYNIPMGNWTGQTLTPGVYCSGGGLTVSGMPPGLNIIANDVTFLATGAINIGASNASQLSARAGSPFDIVAYTTYSGGGPAIMVGNEGMTIDGSLYAPGGLINAGGPDFTVNGSFVANEIFVGAWGPWTINGGGGGGGGNNWRMKN
jgi:hypothetical protein